MARQTVKQKVEQAHYDGYRKGRQDEQELWLKKQQEFAAQLAAVKGSQIVAVTELIKATTKNLSSCGYLINALSKEKGW